MRYSSFLFVAYRSWALEACVEAAPEVARVSCTGSMIEYLRCNSEVTNIVFIGWSEIIPRDILENYSCYCIHPSRLPLFRGGSPIQNQIIAGVLDSAVTLFKMNERLDAGPIYKQKYLSLRGNLSKILQRLSFSAAELVRDLIYDFTVLNNVPLEAQDDSLATYFRRRRVDQSEITAEDFKSLPAVQIYNKIRALSDPYPNAFIVCNDGRRVFFKDADIS